jgi:Nuclease-related domain
MAYDAHRRPGQWVVDQARARSRRVWLLLGLVMALVALIVWLSLGVRSAGLTLIGLGALLVLRRFGQRQIDETGRWLRGARSEVAVGETLAELEREGFTIEHDIEQRFEGNVDHLVTGPSGSVYMIETKHRRYEDDDLRKAKRQAAKIHADLGAWVTPVICLDQRRDRSPYRHAGVWIVCRSRLLGWLRAQP